MLSWIVKHPFEIFKLLLLVSNVLLLCFAGIQIIRAPGKSDLTCLKMLSMGYYLTGICISVILLLLFFYTFMAGVFSFIIPGSMTHSDVPPDFVKGIGLIITMFLIFLVLLFAGIMAMIFAAAHAITNKKRHNLCLFTALAVSWMIPAGTVLAMCTFLVLNRPQIKRLFEKRQG